MKYKIQLGVLIMALMLICPKPAKAETLLGDFFSKAKMNVPVSVSLSTDFYDKYIWRGFRLDGDPSVQPAVTVSVGGLQGGFWGSYDTQNKDALTSQEVDGWIGYTFNLAFVDESLSIVNISAGHTWYNFPTYGTYTKEYYVSVALATFLSPYIKWYSDYGDETHGGGDGNYYMAGVGHSFTLNEKYGIALSVGYEAGFNQDAFIVGDGGYHLFTAGLAIPLSEKATITPKIGYSIPWGDLENDEDNGGINKQKEELYGGVSMSFNM